MAAWWCSRCLLSVHQADWRAPRNEPEASLFDGNLIAAEGGGRNLCGALPALQSRRPTATDFYAVGVSAGNSGSLRALKLFPLFVT